MNQPNSPVKAYLRSVWGIASKFVTCAVIAVIAIFLILFGIGLIVALTL